MSLSPPYPRLCSCNHIHLSHDFCLVPCIYLFHISHRLGLVCRYTLGKAPVLTSEEHGLFKPPLDGRESVTLSRSDILVLKHDFHHCFVLFSIGNSSISEQHAAFVGYHRSLQLPWVLSSMEGGRKNKMNG